MFDCDCSHETHERWIDPTIEMQIVNVTRGDETHDVIRD